MLIGDAETNPFPSSPYLNQCDSLFSNDQKKKNPCTLPIFTFNFVKLYFVSSDFRCAFYYVFNLFDRRAIRRFFIRTKYDNFLFTAMAKKCSQSAIENPSIIE